MSSERIPEEIQAIPTAIRATIQGTRAAAHSAAQSIRARKPRNIYIMGNGTSFYSSLAASYTARLLANPDSPVVTAVMAGDFLHFTPALSPHDVIVGVSASGEFRDVLTLFQRMNDQNLRIGVTHVPDSSITLLADELLVSKGGASQVPVMTKTYASTLTAIHLLLLELFGADERYITDLESTADRVAAALAANKTVIPELAQELAAFDHVFCFGAGSGYATALECALKLKEMALIHAEASETWEMASGPATMVNEKTLCVAFYTGAKSDHDTASVAQHTREWGARVLEIGPESYVGALHVAVPAPAFDPFASLALVGTWALLAYRIARVRGINPDEPGWRDRYISQGMTHIIGD